MILNRNFMKNKFCMLGLTSIMTVMAYAQEPSVPVIPSSHYSKDLTRGLINEFVRTGDCKTYDNCMAYAEGGPVEKIYYSILMAEKYNCPEACYMVYWSISVMERNNKFDISENLWNFAFYYLSKAADMEYESALWDLVDLYQKGNRYVAPDKNKEEKYRKILEETHLKR